MSRTAIRTGIIAIVLLAFTAGIFTVMVFQINNKQVQLREQITILAKHRAQQDTFFQLRKTAEETSEDRAALQSLFFLRGSDSVDFLNEVEALAPRTGVTVETESLTELTEEETGNQWLEMSFELTGSSVDVERFIVLLENLPYVVRLTQLEISERSSAGSSAAVTLQVRLLQYDS